MSCLFMETYINNLFLKKGTENSDTLAKVVNYIC